MTLFTLRGTAYRLHPASGLLIALYAATGHAALVAAALTALLLHEAAHLLAARACGVRVRSVELLPFGGAARMDELDEEPPFRQALVALAGPVASGAAFGLMAAAWARGGGAGCPAFADAARFHFLLCAFNLLPVLPLDGGWALCALLTKRLGARRAARLLGVAGSALGAALGVASMFAAFRGAPNLGVALMGGYLVYAATNARMSAAARCADAAAIRAARLRRRGVLTVQTLAARSDLRVEALAEHLSAGGVNSVWILRAGETTPARVLTDAEFARGLLERPHDTLEEAFLKKGTKSAP